MILAKENIEKQRKVYKLDGCYIKVWGNKDSDWVYSHVNILNELMPGYVLAYGRDSITYSEIEGVLASTVPHTDEFIRDIYKFCLASIEQTKPYVHGDWVLSNIIIKPDNSFQLIDWDNVGIYPEQEYMDKLHRDLHSSFGDKFYDATGI